MTCREKLKAEYPELIDGTAPGGCMGCPDQYGYVEFDSEYCDTTNCSACWDREATLVYETKSKVEVEIDE